jgi:hypothetical protein
MNWRFDSWRVPEIILDGVLIILDCVSSAVLKRGINSCYQAELNQCFDSWCNAKCNLIDVIETSGLDINVFDCGDLFRNNIKSDY